MLYDLSKICRHGAVRATPEASSGQVPEVEN
jgi:hypothetical protein